MRKKVPLQPLIDELLALRSIELVVSERDDCRKRTATRRYFTSSLPGADAQRLAEAVRSHWGWRTVCTGAWTSASMRTRVECGRRDDYPTKVLFG